MERPYRSQKFYPLPITYYFKETSYFLFPISYFQKTTDFRLDGVYILVNADILVITSGFKPFNSSKFSHPSLTILAKSNTIV
jgi:hypothetical protein